MEGSDPRKEREREKGQLEKECEIKRVKDRLDKQKKSQLHTRRERHKRDKKTLMIKIRCILKVKKTEREEKTAYNSFSPRVGRRSGILARTE